MFKIIKHRGKDIIYLDLSNMSISDKAEIQDGMHKVNEAAKNYKDKSALIITNVTKLRFNNAMVDLFKDYANNNTPYTKGSALVGVEGIQKTLLGMFRRLTKRDWILTDTVDEAKNLLVA